MNLPFFCLAATFDDERESLFMKFWFTGYTKCLDPDIEIVVPDEDHGLSAIDILDPSWVSFPYL